MAAFGAGRHMAAKGGGATILDGGHHLQLWKVQMAVICPAIGRPVGAEDIRDLQSGSGHEGPGLSGTGLLARQQIKWAGHVLDRFGRHLGIDRRRLQFGMTKQHLDHPDVCPAFQQMGGEAVPQGVG